MPNSFSIETLEKMWQGVENTEEKLDILFLIALDTCQRTQKLEKRKRFDTMVSGIGGVFGGIMAYVGAFVLRGKGS